MTRFDPISLVAVIAAALLVGGCLIGFGLSEKMDHEFRLACIESGNVLVGGDCVKGDQR